MQIINNNILLSVMKINNDDTEILIKSILEGIFAKKGCDILKIDLRKIDSRIADYFIVCHGNSTSQVDSICSSIDDTVKELTHTKPLHVEGLENCFWVLLDYGNVIVHIFLDEYRKFYNLESLWADADIEKIDDEKKEE